MKPTVGIIGPKNIVDSINKIGHEYLDDIVMHDFIYDDISETTDIIRKHRNNIDIWFFGGIYPYNIARKNGLVHENALYLQTDTPSITNLLFEITYHHEINLECLSFDIALMPKNEIFDLYADLNIASSRIHVLDNFGESSQKELFDIHYSLYKESKVEACITSGSNTHKELKAMNVPAFHAIPSKSTIRQSLNMVCQKGETMYFKKSQIAVQIIQVENVKMVKDKATSYEIGRLNLKINNIILNYAESISGSLLPLGNGKYIIFSTRGSLENSIVDSNIMLEKITLLSDLKVNVGIGYGTTSLSAEQNANLALYNAQNADANNMILITEDGTVKTLLKGSKNLSYSVRNENAELSAKLQKAGVNIATYNKILSVQKNIGQDSLSTANIVQWLGMSERNARRILSSLTKEDLATIIGEETPMQKGRPRILYKLNPI